MPEAVLLLGGNRGEVARTFALAEERLGQRAGHVLARSRDHRTEPWGFRDPQLFLNRALLLDTPLEPEALLDACLTVEKELGRVRATSTDPSAMARVYAARTIDIDILFYGDRIIHTSRLDVPHPRMQERSFALAPAADIVPGLVHPVSGSSVLRSLDMIPRA